MTTDDRYREKFITAVTLHVEQLWQADELIALYDSAIAAAKRSARVEAAVVKRIEGQQKRRGL